MRNFFFLEWLPVQMWLVQKIEHTPKMIAAWCEPQEPQGASCVWTLVNLAPNGSGPLCPVWTRPEWPNGGKLAMLPVWYSVLRKEYNWNLHNSNDLVQREWQSYRFQKEKIIILIFSACVYVSLGTTCGRTCWPCRWSASWIRSGSRRDWTWGWSCSGAALPAEAEVCALFILRNAQLHRPFWIFECWLSCWLTGPPCWPGMVEMIPQAETLRKIQVEHGVTGSFKDRPLADWLQKHNPGEEQYDKVHTPGDTHLC